MKKIKLSEILSKRNAYRALALLMALLMLALVGCSPKEPVTESSGSTGESSQLGSSQPVDSSTDSSTESKDDTSSSSKNTSKIDPLKGNITADYKQTNTTRADANEVEPEKDPLTVNKDFSYTGYAQKERDALLKKILNTPNTSELYEITGTVYYVSPSGNDANDGTSPEKAVRTLPAVNGLPLKAGDAVLFERDSIFRLHDYFSCRGGVIYGSYGKGRKPMILGSAKNFAQEVWKPSKKKNVWEITYLNAAPAGAFFNDGEEIGFLKLSLRALNKNTDFYLNEETSTLYLYCDKGNPSKVWDSIEISQTNVHLDVGTHVQNVTIDNLALRYMGTFGLSCDYNNHYITVTNCELGFIGGAFTGDYRYGNGLQAWCGGHDLKWENNWIYQTYDTATSPQGAAGHALCDYYNISMSGNLYEYNNADIEIWEAGANMSGEDCARFWNWKMDNNIHRFTSLGWGTRAEEGIRGIQGVQVGQHRDHKTRNFSWSNNIIDCPSDYIYNKKIHFEKEYNAFDRKNNTYYIKQSLRRHEAVTTPTFYWENGENSGFSASNQKQWIDVFKKMEPTAKVFWYK